MRGLLRATPWELQPGTNPVCPLLQLVHAFLGSGGDSSIPVRTQALEQTSAHRGQDHRQLESTSSRSSCSRTNSSSTNSINSSSTSSASTSMRGATSFPHHVDTYSACTGVINTVSMAPSMMHRSIYSTSTSTSARCSTSTSNSNSNSLRTIGSVYNCNSNSLRTIGSVYNCSAATFNRSFSSSSSSSSDSEGGPQSKGPRRNKFKVLPFLISKSKAEQSFNQHHSSNPLLAPLSKYNKVKEVLLPFWCMRARVKVQLNSAQVGHRVFRSTYNSATKRVEPQWETEWQTVTINRSWTNEYHPEHEGMQVYANHKYPRPDIAVMKPGASLVTAVPLAPHMMDSASSPGLLRRVQPYTMAPDAARAFAVNFIWEHEREAAEELLRNMMRKSEVQILDMRVTMQHFVAHPVYVPVYVFNQRSKRGIKVRTFVSGVNAVPSGTRQYDANKVATVAAGIGGALMVVLPVIFNLALPLEAIWICISACAAIGGWAASWFPELRAGWLAAGDMSHTFMSQTLRSLRGWGPMEHFSPGVEGGELGGGWEAEFVRQYVGAERRKRSQEEEGDRSKSGARSEDSWSDAALGKDDPKDPLGYYQILGVSPNASTSEIAAAFRGAALKHHPDMYPDELDKRRVTAHFQRITAAYSVLRDAGKRSHYDDGTYQA